MKSEIKYPTNAGMVNSVSALLLREGGSETEVRWAGLVQAWLGLPRLGACLNLARCPLPVLQFAVAFVVILIYN